MMRLTLIPCLLFYLTSSVQAQDARQREVINQVKEEGSDVWKNSYRTRWAYPDPLREIETKYSATSEGWLLREREITDFSPSNLPVSNHRLSYDDTGKLYLDVRSEFTYQNDSLLLTRDFVRNYYGDDILQVYREEERNVYNSRGNLISTINRIRESENGRWTGIQMTYEYDDNGCKSKETRAILAGEDITITGFITFRNDNKCRPVLQQNYTGTEEGVTETYARLTEYNDDPNLSRKTVYERTKLTEAWTLIREEEIKTANDTTLFTTIENEKTFSLRHKRFSYKGNVFRSVFEISLNGTDDFYEVYSVNRLFNDSLLLQESWTERQTSGEAITGMGLSVYEYDENGRETFYNASSTRSGNTSIYTRQQAYRCDGLLNEIYQTTSQNSAKEEQRTLIHYYSESGCSPPAFDHTLHLYPNPVSDVLWIYSENDLRMSEIHVIDRSGRIIASVFPASDAFATLDASGLPAGLYIIRVKGAGFTNTSRFVKTP